MPYMWGYGVTPTMMRIHGAASRLALADGSVRLSRLVADTWIGSGEVLESVRGLEEMGLWPWRLEVDSRDRDRRRAAPENGPIAARAAARATDAARIAAARRRRAQIGGAPFSEDDWAEIDDCA